MKDYIKHNEWNIVEEGFNPAYNKISESIFSLGNGRMGQRANFEEQYSGETLQGNYVAGVYYPDKTKVGWWKNGYPEYFAKVLNAPNWIGIDIQIDGVTLDLAHCEVNNFQRILNMKEGYLLRSFTAKTKEGKEIAVRSKRFCSIVDDEVGVINYSIQALNFSGNLTITPYVDGDISNEDSNYDEKFWIEIAKNINEDWGFVLVETKKTAFQVCTGMSFQLMKNGAKLSTAIQAIEKEKYIAANTKIAIDQGETITVLKYAANLSSENHDKSNLITNCKTALDKAIAKGFDTMLKEQATAWIAKWEESDIVIEGDVAAQQGIRFNIFQMNQTYTGEDERLNIGPKGFTGEKYGGSTYWDTEAYCLPFYLSTADQRVARNLLIYRYKHLERAIENAAKLGFKNGAALYPMVTMNGEECHNEWEITFEEIHRNGAIAYAIYDYIRYTGDQSYLTEYGLEVLIGIARFWAQRVHFAVPKQKYVMHGVTGPNEYENNVNNNWYTNYIAAWCMNYARESIDYVKTTNPIAYQALVTKTTFDESKETNEWKNIADNMFFPFDEARGVFLQQESYLDKDLKVVDDLPAEDRPLNQKWSWDRILRSCFIKQADVLQGLYFFEDHFDEKTIRRNFDFYEPRTVHESSLSPCVHVVLASKLGMEEKAYEMYLRTARLDLDDYNNDTEDGCHITSMAGTWMAVVKGFGGLRIKEGKLSIKPFIPKQWKAFSYKIRFRGNILKIKATQQELSIHNYSDHTVSLIAYGEAHEVAAAQKLILPHKVTI